MLRKFLKITGITLLVLLLLAFLLPILFKGKIIALIKTEINKNLNAKVDFKDADISLFRHFPKLSLGLEDLNVVGVNEFAADSLLSVKQLDVSVNLMSAIKGDDIKIYGVFLDQPRIHAIVNKEGKANWDIVKPDTAAVATTDSSAPFHFNLEKYAIENGYISYKDAVGGMSAELVNLNHDGSGDFTSDHFTLKTKTNADEVNFVYGGIPYINRVKTSIVADFDIDNTNSKYSFKTDEIKLNDLALSTQGFVQMNKDSSMAMDIKFNAPSTDFKNILSFVPAIYQNNFASIKTSGQAVFNGFVKGVYSATQIPAYNINLDVKNGMFQYPDLPKPVKNINLALKVDNPDGVTDHTVINIPQAHLEMDNDPFDFRLLVKNPVTDLFVDAAAKGKLDLSKIAQYVKLDDGMKLTGLLNADVSVAGKVGAIAKQAYDQFSAQGTIGLNNFLYSSKDYPSGVGLSSLLLSFNPKNVTLSNAAGQFMKTNFSADGYINNLLPYIFQNQSLQGVLNAKADAINLNEWMGVSTDTATTAQTAPFVVPANLDITVNAAAGKVHYDNLDITNLTGALQVADEAVKLNNIQGNALDGTMNINGSYSTKVSKTKPDISLAYSVKSLDIQKTFNAFNTVRMLMPIGKFLAGKLSSDLTLTGKLGENMMPDLSTLTGEGNMLMLEGVLSKFQPVDKLSQALNVTALQNISVKDLKAYFELANGKVLIKPFNVKVKGIDMEIGGLHGLDQSMDYTINMKVPRALMGTQANAFVDNLTAKASSTGIPIKVGDVIPIKVKMGGSINSPTISTDLNNSGASLANDLKQQATDFAKAKADSAKQTIKDSVAAAKTKVVQSVKDELTKKLLSPKDTTTTNKTDTKKSLEESGKGVLKKINPFKKKE